MPKHKKQILEGSRAIALVIKAIGPSVVSAYPITPQTHIVEDLAKFRADGEANFEYLRAESEFAAASIVLGASATGVRVYSATSSQGLLLMTEVVYNIAGMRQPVVMTVANRAVSAPINIWNDQSDVMAVRDAGWIQLFAASHQEAVSQHLLAYKLAEKLRLPVMVNVDGFVLTHSYEPVTLPTAALVKKYLPPYQPVAGTYLDPARPATFGAFFGPNDYMETRAALHQDLQDSLSAIDQEYRNLQKIFPTVGKPAPRVDNGWLAYYGPKNPQTVLIALGSVVGTIREVIKKFPAVGVIALKVFRPFPNEAVLKAIGRARTVAVLEKAISLGSHGPLYADLAAALTSFGGHRNKPVLKNYIIGLGGRDVTEKIITEIIKEAPRSGPNLKFKGKI